MEDESTNTATTIDTASTTNHHHHGSGLEEEEFNPSETNNNESSFACPIISNCDDLMALGIVRVPLPSCQEFDMNQWANQLSQSTPINIMGEGGDGEYAFYRNLMEEIEILEFPLDMLIRHFTEPLERYFGGYETKESSFKKEDDESIFVLDDAFCVHYNSLQTDSSGAKHMDPSDVTINLCLEKTCTVGGSHVKFHRHHELNDSSSSSAKLKQSSPPSCFLVEQIPGTATMHWGHHLHETTPLYVEVTNANNNNDENVMARRTNVILTFCFRDTNKSTVSMRTCYGATDDD